MSGSTRLRELGEQLERARLDGRPIAPPIETDPTLTIADAYEIQRVGRELRQLAEGARVIGHKVGLTSAAMQEMLGVDQPDFGYLLDTMVLSSGATIDVSSLIAPRVEAEIAFVLGRPLRGPGLTAAEVRDATAAVAPALELIDSRVRDWRIGIEDTIADNASSALVVVGERVPVGEIDLPAVAMTLTAGSAVGRGRGDAVLGDPALAVAWLANTLGDHGDQLAAGEIVLAGALARALPVVAGERAHAVLDGLGTVAVEFAEVPGDG